MFEACLGNRSYAIGTSGGHCVGLQLEYLEPRRFSFWIKCNEQLLNPKHALIAHRQNSLRGRIKDTVNPSFKR